jgi:hypothetical protein
VVFVTCAPCATGSCNRLLLCAPLLPCLPCNTPGFSGAFSSSFPAGFPCILPCCLPGHHWLSCCLSSLSSLCCTLRWSWLAAAVAARRFVPLRSRSMPTACGFGFGCIVRFALHARKLSERPRVDTACGSAVPPKVQILCRHGLLHPGAHEVLCCGSPCPHQTLMHVSCWPGTAPGKGTCSDSLKEHRWLKGSDSLRQHRWLKVGLRLHTSGFVVWRFGELPDSCGAGQFR